MKKGRTLFFKIILSTICGTLIFSGCKHTGPGKDNNPGEEVFYKGWGPFSNEDPEGTKFNLPTGLTFNAAVPAQVNGEPEEECTFRENGEERVSGIGTHVILCVSFRNSTSRPITLTLPPGLIFISRNRGTQNGMLSGKVAIQVPANGMYFHQLNLHCMNTGKKYTTNSSDPFDLGPVTTVKPAIELFEFLKDKDIYKDKMKSAYISTAISDIGNKGNISEFVWGELRKLPSGK